MRDVNNSQDIQQMELKEVKECDLTCELHVLAVFPTQGKLSKTQRALPHEYKGKQLSDNRSFVHSPIVILGDGLKKSITEWCLLMLFSFDVLIPGDR
ncbi:hypothetical protein AVEN_225849-1 [Araneus ventricosus]|uniref:Uncharacterized protein n=1 Tax=Araneus ventricosus TaxID=182803 RepID=A0A4Y2BCV6_ARAVE|nr:hypothetical protein AVEN_225849-1 [Araneus ventricosus]